MVLAPRKLTRVIMTLKRGTCSVPSVEGTREMLFKNAECIVEWSKTAYTSSFHVDRFVNSYRRCLC